MKIAKDTLLSLAAKNLDEAERCVKEAEQLLLTLMHSIDRDQARLMACAVRSQRLLVDAGARLLDIVRGEHS